MRRLRTKLVRDLWRLRGQVLAIGLIVGCAVAAQVATASTARSMADAVERYYQRYRFPDVFVQLHRAPDEVAGRLAEIPGVATVDARVTADAVVELPGFREPMRAQVVSVPAGGQPRLSQLQVRSGRLVRVGATDEALVSEGFFAAHRMRLGDRLHAILGGRRQELRVVGTALSPEYVYAVRRGELVPDEKHTAILFVGRDALGAALDMQGAFNDVVLRLAAGASQPRVLGEIDRILEPYGSTGARGRDRHGSARFLSDKTLQLKKQATVAPLLFFGVAAYLLSFLLSRVVASQRQEIGTLRALGYTRREVGVHFLGMAVAIVAIGLAIGLPLGAPLGAVLTAKYALVFRIPDVAYAVDGAAVAAATVASLLFGAVGALAAVRRAVRLAPAEAMRPPPPATFRRSALDRILGERMPLAGRMAVRYLARHPLRAALTCFGIAAASATIIAGAFFFDVFSYIVALQFGDAARQDVTVTLTDPRDASALGELRRLPGVVQAEPFRQVSAVVRHGHWYRDVSILGLGERPELLRPVSGAGRVTRIPPAGLVLSSRLAEALHVEVGQTVLVDVEEGARPRIAATVASVIDDVVGMSAYASLDALHRWLGEDAVITGASLRVTGGADGALYRQLQGMPRVAGATLKTAEVETFRGTSGKVVLLLAGVFTVFGAVLAGGVVYNAARASFAERERELATLRLLGFTRREAHAISLAEMWLQVIPALPLGALCGRGFAALLARSTRTDILRLPVVVSTTTYLIAAALVVASGVLVGLVVRRWVERLGLVEVLKAKE